MESYHDGERNTQCDYVRALIDARHATPPGEEADDLAAEIRRELERIRGIDPDLASEVEMEFLDRDSGPTASWGPQWDADRWSAVPGGPEPGEAGFGPDFEVPAIGADEPFTGPDDAIGPDGAEQLLTLCERVQAVAATFRRRDTYASDLIADAIDGLAGDIRATGATMPMQFHSRLDVLAN